MARKGLLKHFKVAMAWVEQNGKDQLECFRWLTPDGLTRDGFFAQYVHVVLVTGYRVSIVEAKYPRLNVAFMDYDCDAIAKFPEEVREAALQVIHNEKKMDAIISTAVRLADSDWEEFKAELTGPLPLSAIASLGLFMGPANKRFLARNIGLDYAKPDRMLTRVAEEFGYRDSTVFRNRKRPPGALRMVAALQEATGERPGVIDYILWEYERSVRSRRT